MNIPNPTYIYRMIHIDNLATCIKNGGFHASNYVPNDGMKYKTIHNVQIQNVRHEKQIKCGKGGVIHDYVPFYFGPRSPMLFQLKTGRVEGYTEGQEPLIYLVSTAQKIKESGYDFVFSDGHGIAAFTEWFDDLNDLDKVDWEIVYAKYWNDDADNIDRQRKKQAEFLVHRFCPLEMIIGIGVYNETFLLKVQEILQEFSKSVPVKIKEKWYY